MIRKFKFSAKTFYNKDTWHSNLILESKGVESVRHLVLKFLSYATFGRISSSCVDIDIGQHYRPDLIITDTSNRIILWGEAGMVKNSKIISLSKKVGNRGGKVLVVKSGHDSIQAFYNSVYKKLTKKDQVVFVGYDPLLVEELENSVLQNEEVHVNVSSLDKVTFNGTEYKNCVLAGTLNVPNWLNQLADYYKDNF